MNEEVSHFVEMWRNTKSAILSGVSLNHRNAVSDGLKSQITSCMAASPSEIPSFEDVMDAATKEKAWQEKAARNGSSGSVDGGDEGYTACMKDTEEFHRQKKQGPVPLSAAILMKPALLLWSAQP